MSSAEHNTAITVMFHGCIPII